MGFEVFQRGSVLVTNVPSVTIQRKGMFSLNRAAMEMLHNPEAVQFLWDPDRRVVGIQAVSIEAANAYPVRRQGPLDRRKGDTGGPVLLAGSLFTRYIQLETSQARRWIPRMEGDILIVDLKQVGQPITSNRNRTRISRSPAGSALAYQPAPHPDEGSYGENNQPSSAV